MLDSKKNNNEQKSRKNLFFFLFICVLAITVCAFMYSGSSSDKTLSDTENENFQTISVKSQNDEAKSIVIREMLAPPFSDHAEKRNFIIENFLQDESLIEDLLSTVIDDPLINRYSHEVYDIIFIIDKIDDNDMLVANKQILSKLICTVNGLSMCGPKMTKMLNSIMYKSLNERDERFLKLMKNDPIQFEDYCELMRWKKVL